MGYFVGDAPYTSFKGNNAMISIPNNRQAFITMRVLYPGSVNIKVGKGARLAFSIISEPVVNEHNIRICADVGKEGMCATTLNLKGSPQHTKLKVRGAAGDSSTLALNYILQHKGMLIGNTSTKAGGRAKISVNALIMPSGCGVADTSVSVAHAGSSSRTEINVAGVLHCDMHSSFKGEIYIPQKARNALASMRGKFMAAPGASVSAVPVLKVHSKDARASHSMAVTSLSEQELNYMCSRGISKEDAIALAEDGLVTAMVNRIADTISSIIESAK
ncbi:MAG: SufD family Fe-S cluster assembly protein [Candidatus Micrarchaeota archaeon]|nr:SufD family Fe-S cluster assembly protein [Candidatus Micrarchaeota archaeon]